jgi:hypothetical protein
LDRLLFWTATDLEMKLIAFRDYYSGYRSHAGLQGETPIATPESRGADVKSYRRKTHCRGLISNAYRSMSTNSPATGRTSGIRTKTTMSWREWAHVPEVLIENVVERNSLSEPQSLKS